MGRYSQAIADMERAISQAGNDADLWNNLCLYQSNAGLNDRALLACERAIELNPRMANAYANKARAFERLGREPEAIDYYNRALALDRNLSFARDGLRRLGAS